MILACILLAIIIVIFIHNYIVFRYFEIKWSPDEIHYLTTQDGYRLAVSRRIPLERRYREPVILCHGLGANRYNLDFNEEYSLARRFSSLGFDTYIAEMRTVGLSSKPHLFSEHKWNIYFDDIVNFDVPAIIQNVRRKSGSEKVFWIGHSLGGMIMYAHLQRENSQSYVKSLIAISSPPVFKFQPELRRFIPMLKFARIFSHIKQESWGRLFAPYPKRVIPYCEIAANIENIDPLILKRIFVNLAADMSATLVSQIGRWVEEGDIKDRKGEYNYSENLYRIQIPVYALTGAADLICPQESVLFLKEKIREDLLKITIAGISTGFSTDYGHGDIIFGRKAPSEIFPLITEYVKAHSKKI